MSTIGWVMILAAGLLLRAVSRGRVMNLSEDLADAFLAIASGNTDDFAAVLARTGESTLPTTATVATGGYSEPIALPSNAGQSRDKPEGNQSSINTAILSKAQSLGNSAKGYRLTATGPNYYDCSGLVWRAVQSVGFKGARFVTANIKMISSFKSIDNPSTGDIVLWPGHHMGIVTTPGRFYSARSVRSGIGESNIKGFRKDMEPVYLRYVGK